MIRQDELFAAGRYNKPHGIHGELSLSLVDEYDLEVGQCVVSEIDGLFVPFFISSVRPKTADTVLVRVDGITDENEAMMLANKTMYLLRGDYAADGDSEAHGIFLDDLNDAEVYDRQWGYIGRVSGYDDRTENILLLVSRPDGDTVALPMVEEFVDNYDSIARQLYMNLPEGILEL